MADKNFYLLENRTRKRRPVSNKNKIILNTRVRLARNLADCKFASISSSQEKNILLKEIKEYVGNIKEFKDFRFYSIKSMGKIQRDLLLKDYMVSHKIANKMQGKGLFVRSGTDWGESSVIIVNHEDHLRIQSARPDLNILEAYHEVLKIEKYFEKKFELRYFEMNKPLNEFPSEKTESLKQGASTGASSTSSFLKPVTSINSELSISTFFPPSS